MKVFLFSDYLKSINGEELKDGQSICDIGHLSSLPDGLVRIMGKLARVCCLSKDYAYIEFIGKIPKEDEVSFSNEITCPHCGSENSDSWEAEDSDDECHCETCGSMYSYERCVDVTYSSKIVERNDSVINLGDLK